MALFSAFLFTYHVEKGQHHSSAPKRVVESTQVRAYVVTWLKRPDLCTDIYSGKMEHNVSKNSKA